MGFLPAARQHRLKFVRPCGTTRNGARRLLWGELAENTSTTGVLKCIWISKTNNGFQSPGCCGCLLGCSFIYGLYAFVAMVLAPGGICLGFWISGHLGAGLIVLISMPTRGPRSTGCFPRWVPGGPCRRGCRRSAALHGFCRDPLRKM